MKTKLLVYATLKNRGRFHWVLKLAKAKFESAYLVGYEIYTLDKRGALIVKIFEAICGYKAYSIRTVNDEDCIIYLKGKSVLVYQLICDNLTSIEEVKG